MDSTIFCMREAVSISNGSPKPPSPLKQCESFNLPFAFFSTFTFLAYFLEIHLGYGYTSRAGAMASRGLPLTTGRTIYIVPKFRTRHWDQSYSFKVFRS